MWTGFSRASLNFKIASKVSVKTRVNGFVSCKRHFHTDIKCAKEPIQISATWKLWRNGVHEHEYALSDRHLSRFTPPKTRMFMAARRPQSTSTHQCTHEGWMIKWSANSFLLSSSSLANHGAFAQFLIFSTYLPTNQLPTSRLLVGR